MCKIQKIRKILGLLIYLELAMIPVMFLLKLARKIPMEIFIFLVAWIFANIGLIIFKKYYLTDGKINSNSITNPNAYSEQIKFKVDTNQNTNYSNNKDAKRKP